MSSIGGIGGGYATTCDPAQFRSLRRPDPEALASKAFAQIDTSGRGYVEKADLQSAMDRARSTSGKTTESVDDLFAKLDGDGDGKVTQEEFSSAATSLADELRPQGRRGGMGSMPPGPPPGGGPGGAGFTKDELTSQLKEIDSSDDPRAKLMSTIVENFDAADTDGDGKVSLFEARTFAESRESASSASDSSTSTSSGSGTSASPAASDLSVGLAQQMMSLLRSYGLASASETTSSLSVSA